MNPVRTTLLPLALASVGWLAGCGGSVADPIDSGSNDSGSSLDGGDGGFVDSGSTCPSTTLGKTIYGPCFDSIKLTDYQGGFGPPPPQGSECNVIGDTYTLDLKTAKLVRESCVSPSSQAAYKKITTTSTMTGLPQVIAALQSVIVVQSDGCVSDGPTFVLDVTAKGTNVTYGDSKWSACQGVPVTGLDGLRAALQAK